MYVDLNFRKSDRSMALQMFVNNNNNNNNLFSQKYMYRVGFFTASYEPLKIMRIGYYQKAMPVPREVR